MACHAALCDTPDKSLLFYLIYHVTSELCVIQLLPLAGRILSRFITFTRLAHRTIRYRNKILGRFRQIAVFVTII